MPWDAKSAGPPLHFYTSCPPIARRFASLTPKETHAAIVMKVESKSLDGLRGFAAFHVALGHCMYSCTKTELMGECAIVIFFLISGFVMVVGYGQKKYSDGGGMYGEWFCINLDRLNICGSKALSSAPALEEKGDQVVQVEHVNPKAQGSSFAVYNFLLKRFARLGPMYYIATIVAIPVCFYIHTPTNEIVYVNVMSFLLLTSWVGVYPINYALWTISTMAFFYVCFPCLIVRLQKLQTTPELHGLSWRMYYIQIALAVVIMLIVLFLVPESLLGTYTVWRMFPIARLPVFAMGMCVGLMRVLPGADHDSLPPMLFSKHDVVSPAVLYALTVLCGIVLSQASTPAATLCIRCCLEVLLPVAFFDWILELTRSKQEGTHSVIERFLRSDAMQFMGKISMSFYMLHAPVLYAVGLLYYHNTHDNESRVADEESDVDIPVWGIFVVLLVSILLGAFFTFYVEIPLHDYIIDNYARKPPGKSDSSGAGDKEAHKGATIADVEALGISKVGSSQSLAVSDETSSAGLRTPQTAQQEHADSDSGSKASTNSRSYAGKKAKSATKSLNKPLLDDIFPI